MPGLLLLITAATYPRPARLCEKEEGKKTTKKGDRSPPKTCRARPVMCSRPSMHAYRYYAGTVVWPQAGSRYPQCVRSNVLYVIILLLCHVPAWLVDYVR